VILHYVSALRVTGKCAVCRCLYARGQQSHSRKEVCMSDKELAAELEEVRKKIDQARSRLDVLEKRLKTAFEKWLKRAKKQP